MVSPGTLEILVGEIRERERQGNINEYLDDLRNECLKDNPEIGRLLSNVYSENQDLNLVMEEGVVLMYKLLTNQRESNELDIIYGYDY